MATRKKSPWNRYEVGAMNPDGYGVFDNKSGAFAFMRGKMRLPIFARDFARVEKACDELNKAEKKLDA